MKTEPATSVLTPARGAERNVEELRNRRDCSSEAERQNSGDKTQSAEMTRVNAVWRESMHIKQQVIQARDFRKLELSQKIHPQSIKGWRCKADDQACENNKGLWECSVRQEAHMYSPLSLVATKSWDVRMESRRMHIRGMEPGQLLKPR